MLFPCDIRLIFIGYRVEVYHSLPSFWLNGLNFERSIDNLIQAHYFDNACKIFFIDLISAALASCFLRFLTLSFAILIVNFLSVFMHSYPYLQWEHRLKYFSELNSK